MRHDKIRRFRPRSNSKHYSRRSGHSNKTNGIHQINSQRNNFRNNLSKSPHNLERIIEKYKHLAKEALSSGDEILHENYLQHSDHFSRILSEVNLDKVKNNLKEDQKNTEKANIANE